MPTIKFKLKDPKYCDRKCPYYDRYYDMSKTCILNDCTHIIHQCFKEIFEPKRILKKHGCKRPQSCIDKYGE